MNLVILQGVSWVPYFHAFMMVGFLGTALGFGYLNILQKKLSRDFLGAFFGLSNSMQSIGGTVAPLIGGALYGYSNTLPYYLTCVMFLFVGILYQILQARRDEVDEDEDEDDEEFVAPLKPGTMTRPMSMQTMSYATSNNLAVNLLRADVSLYAEAYAAHQRQTWKQRRIEGRLGIVSTAPTLSLDKLQTMQPSMGRNQSGNFNFGRSSSLNGMARSGSDGAVVKVGSSGQLRKGVRNFSIENLRSLNAFPNSASEGDLQKTRPTRRVSISGK
jgi:hypothetical protein